jgi:hypothetical protein
MEVENENDDEDEDDGELLNFHVRGTILPRPEFSQTWRRLLLMGDCFDVTGASRCYAIWAALWARLPGVGRVRKPSW